MGVSSFPPFPSKLYSLVDDPSTNDVISWENGTGPRFTIHMPNEFASEICPRYFKHDRLQSFIRQLNQYGFQKKDPDHYTYEHEKFIKGRRDLLGEITRRKVKVAPQPQGGTYGTGLSPNRAVVELGNFGLAGELQKLKRDKDVLVKELMVTRQEEAKLQAKCEGLENRVESLENASKRMQNFIIHYFSHILHPYGGANVASRKRKRLLSADMEAADGADSRVVAAVPQGPSMDMLRQMLQQIQVSGPSASSQAPSAPNIAPKVASAGYPGQAVPQQSYAPVIVQEIPQDNDVAPTVSTSATSSFVSNGNVSKAGNVSFAGKGLTSDSMEIDVNSAGAKNGPTNSFQVSDRSIPSSTGARVSQLGGKVYPRNVFYDRSGQTERGTSGGDDTSMNGIELASDVQASPGSVKREFETYVEDLDDILNLKQGEHNVDLFPPLSELPAGTDMGALVRRIEEIGNGPESDLP